jgi:hypothetical protein
LAAGDLVTSLFTKSPIHQLANSAMHQLLIISSRAGKAIRARAPVRSIRAIIDALPDFSLLECV